VALARSVKHTEMDGPSGDHVFPERSWVRGRCFLLQLFALDAYQMSVKTATLGIVDTDIDRIIPAPTVVLCTDAC